MRRLTSYVAAVIIGVAALGTVASYPVASAEERTSFKLRQEVPTLAPVDIALGGASHGDMLAFEAKISGDDGSVGILRGILITVDLPDDSGDVHEDRIGQLIFDLGNGASLVVAGGSVYPGAGTEMAANTEQVRAVIGGTGTYIGARGQVTTVRNDDGSYEHSFELLD